MFRTVLSGVLDDKKAISDVNSECSAETCKWDEYTTLAVCASIEGVSSNAELDNDGIVAGVRL
jgi:hypothetical protein